ncbi:hypothetical protein ACNH71_006398, partial [Pseudomonas aeruginosa]
LLLRELYVHGSPDSIPEDDSNQWDQVWGSLCSRDTQSSARNCVYQGAEVKTDIAGLRRTTTTPSGPADHDALEERLYLIRWRDLDGLLHKRVG